MSLTEITSISSRVKSDIKTISFLILTSHDQVHPFRVSLVIRRGHVSIFKNIINWSICFERLMISHRRHLHYAPRFDRHWSLEHHRFPRMMLTWSAMNHPNMHFGEEACPSDATTIQREKRRRGLKEINVRRWRENCERLGSPREGKGSLFRNSYYSGLREPSVFRETKEWAGDEKCEMLGRRGGVRGKGSWEGGALFGT